MIIHIVEQITVLSESCSVTDSIGAYVVQCLMNGLRSVCFSGMDRCVNIVVYYKVKGFLMIFGGEVFFGTCQVKAYNSGIFICNG